MKLKHLTRSLGVGMVVLAIAACGLTLPLSMDTPTGVAATDNQIEQITVSWNPVPGADRYYIFRSRTVSGPFWEEGTYGPIPYATVTETTFIDEPLDPLPFYYRVSAYDDATGDESAPAGAVSGTSLAGPVEWQNTQLLFGSFGTARLDVDTDADIVRGYVLSVPDSTDTRVSVRRITNTGTLEQLGSAFADVDGTDPRVADLAVVDGTVYVALVNETDSTVELWRYTQSADTFVRIVGALPPANAARPLLSLVTQSTDTLWLAYRSAGGTAEVREIALSGPTATLVEPPAAVGSGLDTAGGDEITSLEFKSGGGGLVLFYEVMNAGLTTVLGGAVRDTGSWAPYTATGWAAAAIGQDFAVDATSTAAVAARSWILSSDTSGLDLEDLANGVNASVAPADLAGDPDLTETSLGLAADNGTLYLFYQDTTAGGALIYRSTDDGANWTEFSPADFAQADDPSVLEIEAVAGKLFAAWIEGGILYVAAYQ